MVTWRAENRRGVQLALSPWEEWSKMSFLVFIQFQPKFTSWLWWLISVVNLMRCRIIWETDFWTCLPEIILTGLLEVGRPNYCGWHCSLGWDFGLYEKRNVRTHHKHSSFSASWLWMHTTSASSSCPWDFPTTWTVYLELWPQINSFSISSIC